MYRTLVSALVVCLALTACGGKATPDPTEVARLVDEAVKATMVALVTPTPPVLQEYSSPEAVVRAWAETLIGGDCEKAAEYFSPSLRRSWGGGWCDPGRSPFFDSLTTRIDDVLVGEKNSLEGWTKVVLVGHLRKYSLASESYVELSALDVQVEELGGKWYLVGYD